MGHHLHLHVLPIPAHPHHPLPDQPSCLSPLALPPTHLLHERTWLHHVQVLLNVLPIPAHPHHPLFLIQNVQGGFETDICFAFSYLRLKNFLLAGTARIFGASSSGTLTIPIWRPWSCPAMKRYLCPSGLVWSDIPTTWDRSSCSGRALRPWYYSFFCLDGLVW